MPALTCLGMQWKEHRSTKYSWMMILEILCSLRCTHQARVQEQNRTLTEGFGGVAMKNGTKYAFQIAASNAQGIGPLSSKLEMVPRPKYLSSLNNLQGNAGDGIVTLTWNATRNATDYIIFRREHVPAPGQEGSFSELMNQDEVCLDRLCSYKDMTPSNGTVYDYKVKAVMVIDLEGAEPVTARVDNAIQEMLAPQALTSFQVAISHSVDNTIAGGGRVTLTINPPRALPMGLTIQRYKIEILDATEAPINENGIPIILYTRGNGIVTYIGA